MVQDQNFEDGDLVVLLSGGPVMTVSGDVHGGHVYVKWFAGKKMEEAHVSCAALRRATADDTK